MRPQHIALIGLGGTARTAIDALSQKANTSIKQIIVRPNRAAEAARSIPPGIQVIERLEDLAEEVSLVIETAGHGAVAEYGAQILASGRDFGLISTGALADQDVLTTLLDAARIHQRQLLVFNGAIAAVDAVCSARAAHLQSLDYTGVKPPAAWKGTPAENQYDLDGLSGPTVIFEGTARQVALAYPKNANVAATLALAGLGMDNTNVRLIADPQATVNSHNVEGKACSAASGSYTEAKPLQSNPKTSASTAYSIVSYILGGPNALHLL